MSSSSSSITAEEQVPTTNCEFGRMNAEIWRAQQAVHTWLHTVGVDLKDQHTFVDAYCNMIRTAGLPVDRFFCSAAVLHPLVHSKAWKWIDGHITDLDFTRADVRNNSFHFEEEISDKDAPMLQLIKGAPFVRVRATDKVLSDDVAWMQEDGYTDMFGLPTPGTKDGKLEGGFTWSTKRDGGFTDDHIEILRRTLLSLATVLRFQIKSFTCKTLLNIYLGEDAGNRVYGGHIERGEGLSIRSVIWFSDIRNFTSMSGELSRHELVELINGVFEVTVQVIREHKGQVLKFIGDGLMAIFSTGAASFQRSSFSADEKREVDDQAASVCRNARLAAKDLQIRLDALKKERETKGLLGASVGVGLHYGDVSYGNVGAMERLDFTVLGSHVNLASRTESLCSKLGAQVLCTSDFVKLDRAGSESWESQGEHSVKGVSDPVHVYKLQEDT